MKKKYIKYCEEKKLPVETNGKNSPKLVMIKDLYVGS